MSAVPETFASLDVALAHAERLLADAPAQAAQQAAEILRAAGPHPQALLLLGRALAMLGRGDDALVALRRAVASKPEFSPAWLALADHLAAIGDRAGADAAHASHLRCSTRDPALLAAAAAMAQNQLDQAESGLRAHLQRMPTDPAALRMLAEVMARMGRLDEAEQLLARCLELAPSFQAARLHYATVLHRANKPEEALAQLRIVMAAEPANPNARNLTAVVLCRIGDYAPAIEIYDVLLREYPGQARVWLSYGHALKTAGYLDRAIAAYRQAIDLDPGSGEAYWSLANLKTFRFEAADRLAMAERLQRRDLDAEQRSQFEFALGKADEDAGDYAPAFDHYQRGNDLRKATLRYRPDDAGNRVRRSIELFTPAFFEQRADAGCEAGDPIFIVGLPRSGSTLLEQILSSHPQVEGTMELPEIISLTRELRRSAEDGNASSYHDVLAGLDPGRLRELGEQYLARTRIHRKTAAPFFIDKMPNNFFHVGLIHLALPKARIIDARRHPLACCFSGYKQYFALGQNFSYGLEDIGRYYAGYVELMAHFDRVLPGRIHRVHYERMVEDTEAEVRRMLDYCGLPFAPECLRFFENDRPVRTASSEQVRQPIYRDGVDHWRHFEPWLGPLKAALGPILDAYPELPASLGVRRESSE